MRRQIPGLRREPHADVAAHLPHPHRLALEHKRREPEPQVQPLVDRMPRPLQGDVLVTAKEVQRADG